MEDGTPLNFYKLCLLSRSICVALKSTHTILCETMFVLENIVSHNIDVHLNVVQENLIYYVEVN